MMISEQKFTRYLGAMGLLFLVIGSLGGRWTAPTKVEYVPQVTTVISPPQIVRQFVPTNAERECLAQALFAESRSEEHEGQMAVGSSIMNRVADFRYPDTICGVVEYKTVRNGVTTYHFSYQYKEDDNFYKTARVFANMRVSALEIEAREKAYEIADKILDGERTLPTDSLNYHSTTVKPPWASDLTFLKQIGKHKFYTGF